MKRRDNFIEYTYSDGSSEEVMVDRLSDGTIIQVYAYRDSCFAEGQGWEADQRNALFLNAPRPKAAYDWLLDNGFQCSDDPHEGIVR